MNDRLNSGNFDAQLGRAGRWPRSAPNGTSEAAMDTLTRMRTFVEVVDAGGFSAAARKLGRSKALISKYIKELEDELGARLMNRTTPKKPSGCLRPR